MALKVGQRMPEGKFKIMSETGPAKMTTEELFNGKKVVLVSVPGAFTPTCSMNHLPGFVRLAGDLREAGVDTIACMAVNDAWVMSAWGDDVGVGDDVLLLADGNGDYVRSLGLELDGRSFDMGIRGQRFAVIVDDGVVSHIAVEEPAKFDVSRAEAILDVLRNA